MSIKDHGSIYSSYYSIAPYHSGCFFKFYGSYGLPDFMNLSFIILIDQCSDMMMMLMESFSKLLIFLGRRDWMSNWVGHGFVETLRNSMLGIYQSWHRFLFPMARTL
jgi:hypothetical protein